MNCQRHARNSLWITAIASAAFVAGKAQADGGEIRFFDILDYQLSIPSVDVQVDRGMGLMLEPTGAISVSLVDDPRNTGIMTEDPAGGFGTVDYTAIVDFASPLFLDPILGDGEPFRHVLNFNGTWREQDIIGGPDLEVIAVEDPSFRELLTAPNGTEMLAIIWGSWHIWGRSSASVGTIETDFVNPRGLGFAETPHLLQLPSAVGGHIFEINDTGFMTTEITRVIPEPSTLAFFSAAGLLAAVLRRRLGGCR